MKLCSNRGGVNRVIALLLAAIAVMLVVVLLPAWDDLRLLSQRLSCEQAMKSAKDGLIIEYLGRFKEGTVEEAMETLDQVMPARPDICPAGGTVYLIRDKDGIFQPVCGLHDDDLKLRVRLNASRGKQLLAEALKKTRQITGKEPEKVTITLNGKALECVRVTEVLDLRRGTGVSHGYEGIVAYYGIAGQGDFDTKGLDDGDVCYFAYADEYHCARWINGDGWTGDAYIQ